MSEASSVRAKALVDSVPAATAQEAFQRPTEPMSKSLGLRWGAAGPELCRLTQTEEEELYRRFPISHSGS